MIPLPALPLPALAAPLPAALPFIDIPSLDLGFTQIQAFGILVALGILAGFFIGRRRAARLGLDPEEFAQMAIWVILGGFVMAHIVSMVFYFRDRLIEKPWEILFIWSGISSVGGFLGAAITAVIYARVKRIALLPYLDVCAYGIVPGWVFGRLGCTVAHDHPGALSDFALAVAFPDGHFGNPLFNGPRHDLGLYEFAFTLVLIWPITVWLGRKPRPAGFFLLLFLLLYTPVRFVLDFLRATDLTEADPRYFGLTAAQYICVGGFVAALGLLLWLLRRPAASRPSAKPAT